MSQIIPLSLAPAGMLNTYLLRGSQTILVDTGLKNSGARIIRKMAENGVSPADISLILLTHGHADHAGSVAELRRTINAPVAITGEDAPLLETGKNHLPPPITWVGTVIRTVLGKNPTFPAYKPDIILDENFDLTPFGVAARIIPVPGHTAGMIALLTEDNDAIAADAFGGQPFSPRRPSVMYIHEDRKLAEVSLRKLAALRPRRYYIGHGGPFVGDDIERWLERDGDKVPA